MNENEFAGIYRLEEAFRRHDSLYLKKYPPMVCFRKRQGGITHKRILTAVLAAAMLFGGMIGVYAAKDAISDFAVRVYEGFIEIFSEKEETKDPLGHIEQSYSLSVIPQGYALLDAHISEYEIKRLWQNEKGELIVLTQLPLDAKSTVDNEDLTYKSIDIGGLTVLCAEKYDKRCYYWQSEDYVFSLTVPIGFSEEECIALISNLKISG
ncbi:MAG: DUF4367 domain-containing protein [Clostridia bacterium]|nr:DUF4367 domain-containing protein [Clostridia bacterium]